MKNNWKFLPNFGNHKIGPKFQILKFKIKKKNPYKEPNTYNVKKQPKFYYGFVTVLNI
jgi:hypothetical protein